jgi:hypothetical protein
MRVRCAATKRQSNLPGTSRVIGLIIIDCDSDERTGIAIVQVAVFEVNSVVNVITKHTTITATDGGRSLKIISSTRTRRTHTRQHLEYATRG